MEAEEAGRGATADVGTQTKVTFTRLPATEPVEIRFQDLQYRANLGFRKGESHLMTHLPC